MNKKNIHLIILIGVLALINTIIFIFNNMLGLITILFSLYAVAKIYNAEQTREKEHEEEIENLDKHFDDITRSAVFSLPLPITIVSEDGNIIWHNTKFKDIFDKDKLKDYSIENLIPEIEIQGVLEKKEGSIESKVKEKYYQFYYSVVETYSQEDQDIIFLYGFDNTDKKSITQKCDNQRLILMVLEIDNYDEIRSSTDEATRPVVLGEIDKIINTFATQYDGFARKYENDKYILVFDNFNYQKMKEDKFPIVEDLESTENLCSIKTTISAGVGSSIDKPLEIYKIARLALDVAQGRGGNQIVENNGEHLEYYGGKKGAVDKRTKVKSRIIANATIQLIDQLRNVYIMGHKNPDMDSFGSCLGMYSLVKSRGANAKIVLKDITPQIQSLYEEVTENVEGIKEDIITVEEAEAGADENSLIILLDNHSPETAEAPRLLDISSNLILIDHHRRGSAYVESPTLTYLEPYASSASELVTEIIQYADDVKLPKIIADGLLAGIKVDTKSFTLQTGVRTFEAASYLKKEGADSINVNRLFNEPVNTVRDVGGVISQAEIYKDVIAISQFDKKSDNSILIAAKAADGMLSMKNIIGSFVLTKVKGRIHISARSTGKISVQIIMERLGGGGHQTSAAVQLKDVSIEKATERLKKEIDKYLEEEV